MRIGKYIWFSGGDGFAVVVEGEKELNWDFTSQYLDIVRSKIKKDIETILKL